MTQPDRFRVPLLEEAPRWAVIGIFLILAFGALTLARNFLMPLTMGLLLFFVFSPLSRAMVRFGIPRAVAAGMITGLLFSSLIMGAVLLAVPITNTMDNAPRLFRQLDYKMEVLRGSVENIQEAAKKISEVAEGQEDKATIKADTTSDTGLLTRVAQNMPGLFAQLAFTFVLLYFMLASGHLFYKRIVQSFDGLGDKREALMAIYEIEESLGSYLGTITLINACLGLSIGIAMWLWGMPAPALFGVAAFAFNFVPYIGAVGGSLLATVVALVTMPGVLGPFLVGGTYLLLTSIEGQFVTPYFVSRRLQLNAVVVFVTVALWAWLWSVIGMIVAVPMLVVLRVLCAHIPALRSFGNFLAAEDVEMAPQGPARRAPPA